MNTNMRVSKKCTLHYFSKLLFSSSNCSRSWILSLLGGWWWGTLDMQTSPHVCNICPLCFPSFLLYQCSPSVHKHTSLQTMLILCDSVSLVHMAAVPEALDAHINASKTVLKQGEPLSVNCTAHGVELVYFSWDLPNKDVSGLKNKLPHLDFFQLHDPLRENSTAQITSRCAATPNPWESFMDNTFLLKI